MNAMEEIEISDRLQRLGVQIPAEVLTEIRAVHDGHPGCAAHSEGQTCCLDWLLGRSA